MRDLLGAARTRAFRARHRPPSRPTCRRRITVPASTATCSPAAPAAPCSSRRSPSGDDLHELYRGVEDEAYLDEEAGRRATAERLLDLIGKHVPGAAACSTWAAATGCCSTRRARRGYEVTRARAVRQLGRLRPRGPRSRHPRAGAGRLLRRRGLQRRGAGGRAGAPRRSSRGRRAVPGAAGAGRSAVRRHARPVVARPLASPASAGGATCRRTPTCSRARRCAR